MTQVTATVKVIKDIKERDMYYLILEAKGKTVYVSIGKKTHDGVKALQEEAEQQELPREIEENETAPNKPKNRSLADKLAEAEAKKKLELEK